MKYPRIMIAAGASGQGKTTLTCGLLTVLKNHNKKVHGFKCGPDYIDPLFHQQVLNTPSKNLDTFFTDRDKTIELFQKGAKDCDISVMEGVMGYYDGIAGITTKASSFELASITKTPVILVIDGKGSSVSLCATIKGFISFRQPSMIQGVILNHVSKDLFHRLKDLIEKECGISVVGYLPHLSDIQISSRHLGLTTPEDLKDLGERLRILGNICEDTLDLEGILQIAEAAEPLEAVKCLNGKVGLSGKENFTENRQGTPGVTIGVAKDAAFCFYYKDNLRMLEDMGAKLSYFSPLRDAKLPKGIHGLLLGGGYPEEHGQALEENVSMRNSIKTALTSGMPCIAECGGYAYLHERLTGRDGVTYSMTGYLEGNCYMTSHLSRFGYMELESQLDQLLGTAGTKIKGHEFHYLESTRKEDISWVARKPESNRSWLCAYSSSMVYAGFPHLYFESNPQVAEHFLRKGLEYGKIL